MSFFFFFFEKVAFDNPLKSTYIITRAVWWGLNGLLFAERMGFEVMLGDQDGV